MNAPVHGRYRLVAAFPPSDVQRRRAIEMWTQENVFPDASLAFRRAQQLVLLLEREDEVAGVCTVLDVLAPMAGERVWMYRTFVRPADRGSLAAFHVLGEAFDLLKKKTPADGPVGVFLNTENLRLKGRGVEARLARMGWRHLGLNRLGQAAWLRRF